MSVVTRFVAASHPLPTLAVTSFVVALALSVDLAASTVVAIGLATLSGQLSIGWSNDLIDADRDATAGRTDKPLADGRGRATLTAATAVALLICVMLSVTVGALAAAAHLIGVACGWLYNLGLKATLWSWAPYAVAFGLLPTWVFAAQPGAPSAPAWMAAAAGLLGVSAHLVNAAPDVDADRASGITGLPQRLGSSGSVGLALVLLTAGAVIGLVGPDGAPAAWQWVVLTAVAAIGAGAVIAVRAAERAGRGLPRFTFAAMLILVALVITVILSGATL